MTTRELIVWDDTGRVVSYRNADGTGYDYVRDERGNVLWHRNTDGTGYDYVRDERGNVLRYRHTDGTGYDCTYDESNHCVWCRHKDGWGYDMIVTDGLYQLHKYTDGTYAAGCRTNLTLEQALEHWGPERVCIRTEERQRRAAIFYEALCKERDALIAASTTTTNS